MIQQVRSWPPAPDRRPRIGVNLLWLVPGEVGGTEEYATRLLTAFANIDDVELTIFCRPDLLAAFPELDAAGQVVSAPLRGSSRLARVAVERSWLVRAAAHLDAVHHLGGTMPLRVGPPGLLTVHDLQPLDAPELFSPAKARWLAHTIPASVRAASVVMTPSRFVAERLVGRFGIDRERIHVIPAHSGVTSDPVTLDAALDRSRLTTYGLARVPYVLYPAITYPHKNHQVLVHALERMAAQGNTDLHLVFTGRPDGAQADIDRAIERAGLGDRVRCLGRVPKRDLAVLFRHALVLGFPSRYEGFGLPAIEAMAHGVPVVAADATALPEVVVDAGLLVDPDDVDGWVQALRRAAFDATVRSDLIARGYRRAADFEADVCAKRLAEVYRSVVAAVPLA